MSQALSLLELERAARAIDLRFVGLALDRVSCRAGDLVLRFSGRGGDGERVRRRLVLCCDREHAGVGELDDADALADTTLPPFAQYLRAHLTGARITSATLRGGDRILALSLVQREGERTLLLQLLGPRSNLYLLDASDCIEAFHRPPEDTRRELIRGGAWEAPASAPPHRGTDRFAETPDSDLLVEIERHLREERSGGASRDRRRRIITALDRELRALTKRAEALRGDMKSIPSPDALARHGELLKSVLPGLRTGMREIVVTDPVTEEAMTLPVDPKLTPAKNLEACFDASRRARRRIERGTLDLQQLDDRIEQARAQRTRIDTSDTADEASLMALEAESPLCGLLRRSKTQPSPAAPRATHRSGSVLPARLRPKRYRSHDGLEIWVGKSDASNDHLSTRLARGNDLFLHVDGGAGSHVILRTEGQTDAPQESLLEAAELAVHFSKQRGALAADVLVASAKDVSKPRGVKPGLVHVRGGRTIRLRREPARVARVLASRLDDD